MQQQDYPAKFMFCKWSFSKGQIFQVVGNFPSSIPLFVTMDERLLREEMALVKKP
jgi:hypothetical protein